jgi:purine nucleosidase
MAPRPIIIDCDPGQDDSVALFLAFAAPEALTVLGIAAVAGNVPVERTAANARIMRELAGRPDVPVYAGCARPLVRPPVTAEHVHGDTGIGGAVLPEPVTPLAEGHAVDFIIATLLAAPERTTTLCALGPLTNVAVALRREPKIAARIAEIVLMGGGMFGGNVTAAAEFNIFADPHAAAIVFASGVPIVMLPLDATHQVISTRERIAAIAAIGNPAARAAADMLSHGFSRPPERRGELGPPLHDPCVIAYLLWPELFGGERWPVSVEVAGDLTFGMTVVDRRRRATAQPNALVIDKVDAGTFYRRLTEMLARLPG